METPCLQSYTDEKRIEEIRKDVEDYLRWVSQHEGHFSKSREVPLKEFVGTRVIKMEVRG
jgi:hypothetical protein